MRIKTCPTCKRTYADETLTFCLVDGSILSAPYDPHETLRIPTPQVTDPAPTEILNTSPRPSDSKTPSLPTIQSRQPPPLYSPKEETPLKEKQSGKPWVAIGIGIGIVMSVVFIFASGAIRGFDWFGKDRATGDQFNTNVPTPNVSPTASPTATPTATVGDGGWGPRNDQASLTGERLTYYPGTSPEKCQADCDENPRCTAYTYIRAGFYNPTDPPMCYLMSVAKDFTPSPCCISKVKR